MTSLSFYPISHNLRSAIDDKKLRPFVRLALDRMGDGDFAFVPDTDIVECFIINYKEKKGSYCTSGTITLDNTRKTYSPSLDEKLVPGIQVQIWYCVGSTENSLHRFSLYVDNKGFQDGCIDLREKTCTINLVDYSYYLKNTDKQKDWTADTKASHTLICDKSQPEKSLVHIIAKRAKLGVLDIDSSYLSMELPYAEITSNVWDELALLATAYKAHLECGTGAILTFAYSPYDLTFEPSGDTELVGEYLTERDITLYKRYDKYDDYKNTLRLKWTHYSIIAERVKLWAYSDFPVLYDTQNIPSYPFANTTRDIEKYPNYEAVYSYTDIEGRTYRVALAENIDSLEVFRAGLLATGQSLEVLNYDTSTYKDRALVQLRALAPTVLHSCEIWGYPIIAEQNFSHFIGNEQSVAEIGTQALNVTNKYLSDSDFEGLPFYERWALDSLADVSTLKRGYVLKTNKPLIHSRAGACIGLNLSELCGLVEDNLLIEKLTLNYKKCADFETSLWVTSR